MQTTLSHTLPVAAPRRLRRHAVTAARVALGLVFFVFGLNGWLQFIPGPTEPMPEAAIAFTGGLFATGYFFPLLVGTEVLAGALLLANRFVPLALVVLAPVVLNIALFHTFVWHVGRPLAMVLLVLEVALGWAHRDAYAALFVARR